MEGKEWHLVICLVALVLLITIVSRVFWESRIHSSYGIEEYCGDTYTLDVSPLRTKVSCRGEEFVIFPNVDEMSPEEFRAYLEAKEGIPVGLKRDLREK